MTIYGPDFADVYNAHWHAWTDSLRPWLLKTVRSRAPQAHSWLDLCCGTGALLRYVVEAGYEATGVDASVHQLEHARTNAPDATVICGDIRDLSLDRRFDVITCLYDSLNYLTDPADVAAVVVRVAGHVSDRGVFIFDVNTRDGLEERWNTAGVISEPDRFVVNAASYDEQAERGRCVITGFVREGNLWRRFDEEHIQRGYQAEELEPMLAAAGLGYESLDGETFEAPGERCGRLFYVCRPAPPA